MAFLMDFPWIHQLAATTWSQVDQTCPVGYIFVHVFTQRSFNEIKKLDTSVMDAIYDRFKVIVSYYGITQQWVLLTAIYWKLLLVSRSEGTFSGAMQSWCLWQELIAKSSGLSLFWLRGASLAIRRHLIYPWKIRWDMSSHLPMSNW